MPAVVNNITVSGVVHGGLTINNISTTTITNGIASTGTGATWQSGSQGRRLAHGETVFTNGLVGDVTSIKPAAKSAFSLLKPARMQASAKKRKRIRAETEYTTCSDCGEKVGILLASGCHCPSTRYNKNPTCTPRPAIRRRITHCMQHSVEHTVPDALLCTTDAWLITGCAVHDPVVTTLQIGDFGGSMNTHRGSQTCRKRANQTGNLAGKSRRKGSSVRVSYTFRFKHRVVSALTRAEEALGQSGIQKGSLQEDISCDFRVSQSLVSKWKKDAVNIEKRARSDKNKRRSGNSTYKYGHVDAAVQTRMAELRSAGRSCSPRWLLEEYAITLQEMHPDYAATWKGTDRFRWRYYKRNNICLRKPTNNHQAVFLGENGREVRLKSYLAVLMRRISSGCLPGAVAGSVGRYPQDGRFSLDQVGHCFHVCVLLLCVFHYLHFHSPLPSSYPIMFLQSV